MDPLLSLGPLATYIEHPVGQVANDEGRLGNTGGLDTRAEHILVGGHVVGLANAVNGIEVAESLSEEGKSVTHTHTTHYLAESFNWYSRDRLKHS